MSHFNAKKLLHLALKTSVLVFHGSEKNRGFSFS